MFVYWYICVSIHLTCLFQQCGDFICLFSVLFTSHIYLRLFILHVYLVMCFFVCLISCLFISYVYLVVYFTCLFNCLFVLHVTCYCYTLTSLDTYLAVHLPHLAFNIQLKISLCTLASLNFCLTMYFSHCILTWIYTYLPHCTFTLLHTYLTVHLP